MRNSQYLRLALVAGAFVSRCAFAADAAHAETTAELLTRIEAETAVLKARARKAEVQAQIAGKQAEIATRVAEARRASPPPSSDGPWLRAIEGVGDHLFATIELPNRVTSDVREGDRLADGTRVVSIHPTEVLLETPAKRRIRLAGTTGTSSPAGVPLAVNADMALPVTSAALPELPAPRGVRR